MGYNVAVIGGGPAGMAAALGALSAGAKRVLLVERDDRLGGILNQCSHLGFGLRYFGRELTGVEYAKLFRGRVEASDINVLTGTTVLKITKNRELILSGAAFSKAEAGAVILASGCRERPIGTLPVAGTRPAGIFAAGMAQRMLNLAGFDIGRRAVILGSGDVGMIVARELKQRGAIVPAVIEQREVCGGLARNKIACLDAFQIPLVFDSTIAQIYGRDRITAVDVINKTTGKRTHIPCDTLIVSVGLTPEQELLESLISETGSVPEFLSVCGNACFVHDLVDDVSEESERAGRFAADYNAGRVPAAGTPAKIAKQESGDNTVICIACPKECVIAKTAAGYTGMACGRAEPLLA